MQEFPLLVVDFDGTICDHQYPDVGPPKPLVREAMERLKDAGYKILIHTVRTASYWKDFGTEDPEIHKQRVRDFMEKHRIPYDGIWEPDKALSVHIIDDVAIAFEENWDEIANRLNPARVSTINVVMGLPLSGKTHYSVKALSGMPRVDIREIAHSLGMKPGRVNAPILRRIEDRTVKTLLDGGRDVVVEGLNLTQEDRERYLSLATDRRARSRLIYLEAGPNVCWERNGSLPEERRIAFEAMDRAKRSLQPPSDREGFDEITVVSPDSVSDG